MIVYLIAPILFSSTLGCAPHKPLQSLRPSIPSQLNPHPNPDPDPTPPSSKVLPVLQEGCPILSPDLPNCFDVFESLGEPHPSAFCSGPVVSTSSLFLCPSQQPVILVFEKEGVVDMYSSVECEVSTGTWIFYGETEKRSDELKFPLSVTCVNPHHTGNQ